MKDEIPMGNKRGPRMELCPTPTIDQGGITIEIGMEGNIRKVR